jgi:hypothetical protein
MRRLLSILLFVTLLAALTPSVAHASPLAQDGGAGETEGIGSVIGTLGLYAAMMAVLAIGAEVLIDAVRPIFGLKRKTSATEALTKMKKWLPGTLEELGVSPQAQQQLNEQLETLQEVTTQFEDNAERVRKVVQEQLPDILKDLAIHSLGDALDKHWSKLEERLKKIDPKLDVVDVKAWLEATLTRLQEENVAELAVHLQSVSTLLDAVREQNHKLQGPLLKSWRWLRGSLVKVGDAVEEREKIPQGLRKVLLFLCRIPAYLEYALAWLRGAHSVPDGDTLRERIENLGKHKPFTPLITLEEAARRILEEDTVIKDQEKNRIVWLRVLSGIVGIALAAVMQVDSLQLLEPVLGNAADTFRPPHEAGQTIEWYTFETIIEQEKGGGDIDPTLSLPGLLGAAAAAFLDLTPGIVLSGLGAAAGSGFWHDQLSKLRSAKQIVTQVQQMTG